MTSDSLFIFLGVVAVAALVSSRQQRFDESMDALLRPKKRRNPGLLRDRGSTFD
jgi:hypothetical protein